MRAGEDPRGVSNSHEPEGPESPERRGRRRSPPAVRQIRLLHPSDSGGSSRPLFVAVFARPAPFLFRVAPFGRFSVPAVPGEMTTGLPQVPLRVLCVWNARILHAETLERGWVVGRLAAAAVDDAVALDVHDGSADAARVANDRTGPRLCHPADPRHVYLRQETVLMDRACREGAAASVLLTARPWMSVPDAGGADSGALDKAAEGTAVYGRRHVWSVSDASASLEVEAPGGPEQPCTVTVRSAEGLRSAMLDGAFVVGFRRVVRIVDGQALLTADDLAGGLRLYDRDGGRIRLANQRFQRKEGPSTGPSHAPPA